MTPSLRLFAIETRRSVGLWAFPVLAGLAWLAWYIRRSESDGVAFLWPEASVAIGFTVTFLGPAAGGLAAWVAGRDRRRGLGDLLATMPRSGTVRELILLAATALWALLAYVVAATYLGIQTAREATWGGPVAPPILIAGLAIAVQAAIGFAVGSFAGSTLPSRLMAGLVPVGLFFAQMLVTLIPGNDVQVDSMGIADTRPYENLSPFAIVQEVGGSVFWMPPMEIVWGAVAWLLGLGGLALAVVALRHRRRSLVAWGTLAAAALAVVVGWSQLVPAPVFGREAETGAIGYEPVCTQRSIVVCVHPAYEGALEETADLVDRVVRPLAGLPEFPVRAEQMRPPSRDSAIIGPPRTTDPATLPIWPVDSDDPLFGRTAVVAIAAVQAPSGDFVQLTPAQGALVIWLMRQVGVDPSGATAEPGPLLRLGDGTPAEAEALLAEAYRAADRFGSLSPEEQRAWLEANFAALRAGTLTLAEMA